MGHRSRFGERHQQPLMSNDSPVNVIDVSDGCR
jgi:hypothetical protein